MSSDSRSTPMRICNISFLNSVPFSSVRGRAPFEYREETPIRCAQALAEGHADMACISLVEFVRAGSYRAIPFGVASRGPVDSVMLLAKAPLSQIRTVFLDAESQTSAVLLKVLLAPEVREFKVALARDFLGQIAGERGGLVIGDQALACAYNYPYRYDLARMWRERTGLPFLFAVWAGTNEACERAGAGGLGEIFRQGIAQREALARSWAEAHQVDAVASIRYINSRVYHALGSKDFEGASEFVRQAEGLSVLPEGSSAVLDSNASPTGVGTVSGHSPS